MRKWKRSIAVVLAAVFLSTYSLAAQTDGGSFPSVLTQPDQPQAEDIPLTYFRYSNTGSSAYEIYSYCVAPAPGAQMNEMSVLCEFFCGRNVYTLPASEAFLQALSELIVRNELKDWDGFEANNRHILDGRGFSLKISFADGTSISAHGDNRFPDNWNEAVSEMDELFQEYLKKYSIDPYAEG